MVARTKAEWDPDYADISYGLFKGNEACMDSDRIECTIEWLKQNQDKFLGGSGWRFPRPETCKEGGFGTIFVLSHPDYGKCVVKMVSLVQLLDLGHSETDNDKELLEQGKKYLSSKLENLITITNNPKATNLCKLQNYAFVPYGNGDPDISEYNGMYARVLADYIVCTKMELLQEINYIREFCNAKKKFDEQLLIEFGIKMCDSLIQLKGYYHRDLHPENFMLSLDESRTLKLIDFDTVLEKGKNAPHLDFVFEARCDGSMSELLSYKSPDVNARYDVYDDIYSAGCILYDIANYDYEANGFRPRRYSNTNEVLISGDISEDFFKIIQKACSPNYRNRYSSWEAFKNALLEIRYSWRKYQHIRTIPGTCEEWSCRKGSKFAIMKIIAADDNRLKEEYKHRDYIYRTLIHADIHFPKLLDEFEKDGLLFLIEEEPPEVSLRNYIQSSAYDEKYYVFVRRFIKNYIRILSSDVKVGWFKSRKLASYRNLITSDRIYILNHDELWFNGLAIPEREHRDYIVSNTGNNYMVEYAEKKENNECTAVYSLGVLLYEMLTGDTNITNTKPRSKIRISDEKNGDLLDLMSSCLAAYENPYTIGDIVQFIDAL